MNAANNESVYVMKGGEVIQMSAGKAYAYSNLRWVTDENGGRFEADGNGFTGVFIKRYKLSEGLIAFAQSNGLELIAQAALRARLEK